MAKESECDYCSKMNWSRCEVSCCGDKITDENHPARASVGGTSSFGDFLQYGVCLTCEKAFLCRHCIDHDGHKPKGNQDLFYCAKHKSDYNRDDEVWAAKDGGA